MHAFLTGADGFLGRNVVDRLRGDGVVVTALQRRPSPWLSARGVIVMLGDVRDPVAVHAAMAGASLVVHLAADSSFWRGGHARQHAVNVDGTRHVARAALAHGARLVHLSSAGAFGLHDARVSEDTSVTGDRCPIGYVRTKALGDREVLAAVADGLDAVLLHPTTAVGPHERKLWRGLYQRAARGRLRFVAPGRTCFASSERIADAVVAAATRGAPGSRFLLGGPVATWGEAGRRVAELFDVPPPRTVPRTVLRVAGVAGSAMGRLTRREPPLTREAVAYLVRRNRVDDARACQVLGYRPMPLDAVFRRFRDWLIAEGHLEAPWRP